MLQTDMIKRFIPLLFIVVVAFYSCSDDEPQNIVPETSLNTIMPLGASRVEGNRPNHESFRYELWKQLIDGDWEFDFIGTKMDPSTYPVHSGQDFDPDHEGRGGWTSGQILAGIDGWLEEAGSPDIVLFSSPGGNDALQGMPYDQVVNNVNAIIDRIQDANPNVTIIVEKLAPGLSFFMTEQLLSYFNQMQTDIEIIAADQSTSTSRVITVDMATGFMDSFLADPVHYNTVGAKFVADRYYDVLSDVMER